MKLDKIIPEPTAILREGIIVLGGLLLAAWVLSKFPALQQFVVSNSLTVKNGDGNVLY
jgi:hypothetical protein